MSTTPEEPDLSELNDKGDLDYGSATFGPQGFPIMALSGKFGDDLKALLDLYGIKATYDYGEGWWFEEANAS